MKYSLWIDGKASGPYDANQIQSLYRDGVVSENDLVNPDGSKSWPMLKEVFPVETWNGSASAGTPFGKVGFLDFRRSQGSEVNLVGINIPFLDLVILAFKLTGAWFVAGLIFAIPFYIIFILILGAMFHR